MMGDEYMSIYWAAACLVFWAGGGSNVTAGQLNDAVNMVCDRAELTPSQEGLMKTIVWKMLKKCEGNDEERSRRC